MMNPDPRFKRTVRAVRHAKPLATNGRGKFKVSRGQGANMFQIVLVRGLQEGFRQTLRLRTHRAIYEDGVTVSRKGIHSRHMKLRFFARKRFSATSLWRTDFDKIRNEGFFFPEV